VTPPDRRASDSTIVAFVLVVPCVDAELAADGLWMMGVRGIEERPHMPLAGASGEAPPMVELWTSFGADPAAAVVDLVLEPRWSWRTERIEAAPANTWRDHAQPIYVSDRAVVVPAWLEVPGRTDDRLVLSVEPGAAFGLGDHPTTMLSLGALLEVLDVLSRRSAHGGDAAVSAPNVLDVGCGSGLLAIAAARSGARRVRAVDVSQAAIDATVDNSRRNGVEHLVVADRTKCSAVDGQFDVVVANILAPVLVALAPELRRLTARGGRLIVSGVLSSAHGQVVAALAPMEVERVEYLDGWAALVLRHPGDQPFSSASI
jgi:ribosomal protein L11 methyltransferase